MRVGAFTGQPVAPFAELGAAGGGSAAWEIGFGRALGEDPTLRALEAQMKIGGAWQDLGTRVFSCTC